MAQFSGCPHCLPAKGSVTMEDFLHGLRCADINQDGIITQQELHNALRALGLRFAGWKAWRAMAHVDGNRNHSIDNDGEVKGLVEYARNLDPAVRIKFVGVGHVYVRYGWGVVVVVVVVDVVAMWACVRTSCVCACGHDVEKNYFKTSGAYRDARNVDGPTPNRRCGNVIRALLRAAIISPVEMGSSLEKFHANVDFFHGKETYTSTTVLDRIGIRQGARPSQTDASRELTMDQFKELLRQVDVDKDGNITRDDLREAFRGLGLHCTWWRSRRAMKYVDLNRNGSIDNELELRVLIEIMRVRWGIVVHDA
ncbi:hypothetical protein Taro_049144 [Colocasia esculenta]|uniref:EF-hand domain-containing protein n=1 Tax=Colocasia esculenta TaxID=4460 RepID=A0A843XA38_COLES|nr:hypothetical protein [Colocasia esculenta]